MKLLDVLAKELKEWPDGAACIVQDSDGEVKAGVNGKPEYSSKFDVWLGCSLFEGLFYSETLSEDYSVSVVTEDMWGFAKVKSKTLDSLQSKHKHSEMIALCAEFAQTMETPMSMFQYKGIWDKEWQNFEKSDSVTFFNYREYRLRPKTKLINGVEIPDLPFTPFVGCEFYCANIGFPEFYETGYMGSEECTYTERMVERGLIYPYTQEGKEAAIEHSKALLGITGDDK